MLIKNAIIYKINEFTTTVDDLEDALAERRFKPCPKHIMKISGWSEPMGDLGSTLVHAANGNFLLNLRKEERVIPPAALKKAVEERIQHLKRTTMEKIDRKKKAEIKEEVLLDMMPRAFTKISDTRILILPRASLMIVDSASPKKVEKDVLPLLGKVVSGSPLYPQKEPGHVMTTWLTDPAGQLPDDIEIGLECEMIGVEDSHKIRCTNMFLESDEIKGHLAKGDRVSQLRLSWQEKVITTIHEDFFLKKIKFSDDLIGSSDEADPAARFDADFTLVCEEMTTLITDLVQYFGGESENA